MPNQNDRRVSKISTWIYCICILMFKSVVSEAYRYTCNQLCELRCSWLLDTSVRDVIRSLGCQRRRRGCRSGKRARDRRVSIVNNNIASRSADRSSQLIPVVTTLRRTSVTGPLQLYRGHREHRPAVRRELHCDAHSRYLSTSSATAVGLLNVRSVSGKSAVIYDHIIADRLHLCALVETWHDSVDSPQHHPATNTLRRLVLDLSQP